jgi:acetyl-CoA carboxylase carboxyltransferase component
MPSWSMYGKKQLYYTYNDEKLRKKHLNRAKISSIIVPECKNGRKACGSRLSVRWKGDDMARSEAAVRRIEGILDAGSFMEMGGQVLACDTTVDSRDAQKSDGVITGYGTVDGRPVYVYSQDPAVLGGSIAEMHVEKILRLYEMALRSGAPVIALLDSAGLRISEGAGALDAYGRLYRTMAQAKGIIPQIAGAFGPCGGGCAFIAALCDFLYTADDAAIFVHPKDARREENGQCLTKGKSPAYPAGEQLRHGSGTGRAGVRRNSSPDRLCASDVG